MPFTFKLSQRLARMHDRSLSSPAACRLLPVVGAHLPVVRVVDSPASTLFPRTTHHTPRRVAPRWTTSAQNE
jgi:hypothetical protein